MNAVRENRAAVRQDIGSGPPEGLHRVPDPFLLLGQSKEDLLERRVPVGHLLPEVLKGPLAPEDPVVQDPDAIAEALRHLHRMGGEQDPR